MCQIADNRYRYHAVNNNPVKELRMHARTRRALLPALAAVSALITGCGASSAGQEQAAPPPPQVSVARVGVQSLHEWQEFTGRLQAVKSVDVRPRVSGYVESVHFDEGSRVAAGATLFEIDPRPFRAEVERLAAERQRAQAELELAITNQEQIGRAHV